MVNKKGQAAIEFLMTYGWAILVILISIGALVYFGISSSDGIVCESNGNTWDSGTKTCIVEQLYGNYNSYQEQICDNLDKNGSVYFEVINYKNIVFNEYGDYILEMYGNESKPWVWDNNGVMCRIPILTCSMDYVLCEEKLINIPVNYTEWENWYNGQGGD